MCWFLLIPFRKTSLCSLDASARITVTILAQRKLPSASKVVLARQGSGRSLTADALERATYL